ncbi:MAG: 3-phosphoshikimate 1-carboxyvinyltransferase [Lachnospiraceae bacterium]|nr:3-phosphoshikimate 1-carboxyvinyltransferase [Lachnospiraceae bacterium]
MNIITGKEHITPLKGSITVPGDKSISHRSIMLGALAKGDTHIRHFLSGADCLSTIACFRKLGVDIDTAPDVITVRGKGLYGLTACDGTLDTGNSGTTTRLISGILSGQPFSSRLSGDESLNKRPMKRIIEPLSQMGADIKSEGGNGCCPLIINPSKLSGIDYNSPVASAQVKSAILLAGLYADTPTSVTEPALSRDHTERMLSLFGATVKRDGLKVSVLPDPALEAADIDVPGDISSAAYFIAAALLVPGSELLVKNVGINKTRAGFLMIAEDMGADLEYLNLRGENDENGAGEPVADILVRSSSLHSCEISGDIIPTLIDEIPMLAVMAAFAEGTTVIKDAAELKVKETDRIMTICDNLRKMGGDITPADDGMIINGGRQLHGGMLDSYLDHRIAMSFKIAALASGADVQIRGADCVNISYPQFYSDLEGCLK